MDQSAESKTRRRDKRVARACQTATRGRRFEERVENHGEVEVAARGGGRKAERAQVAGEAELFEHHRLVDGRGPARACVSRQNSAETKMRAAVIWSGGGETHSAIVASMYAFAQGRVDAVSVSLPTDATLSVIEEGGTSGQSRTGRVPHAPVLHPQVGGGVRQVPVRLRLRQRLAVREVARVALRAGRHQLAGRHRANERRRRRQPRVEGADRRVCDMNDSDSNLEGFLTPHPTPHTPHNTRPTRPPRAAR